MAEEPAELLSSLSWSMARISIKSERRPARALVLPQGFKCKVSKEFIDEMATLADDANKLKNSMMLKMLKSESK